MNTNLNLILKILNSQDIIKLNKPIDSQVKHHQERFVIERDDASDIIIVDFKENEAGDELRITSNNELLFKTDYRVLCNPVDKVITVLEGL